MDRLGWTRRDALRTGLATLMHAGLVRTVAARDGLDVVPLAPDDARTDAMHRFWERLPEEFPLHNDVLHFNTAGVGIPPVSVLERCHAVATEVAASGDPKRSVLDNARAALARFFGATPDEIALLRNATEGMNLVARGIDLRRNDEVVLTTHEHPGGAAPWVALRRDAGIVLRLVEPQSDPAATAASIVAQFSKRTRVVVLSHVTATVGLPLPIEAVAAEARSRGIWCVVDGAQAAGILDVNCRATGADCYIAGGHKWLLGPQETGFLWIRRERLPELGTRFAGVHTADAAGWDLDRGRIEFRPHADRYEYGTRSASQAAGLAGAIEWIEGLGLPAIRNRACALAQRFHTALTAMPAIEVLTPAAATATVPIVTFRVRNRPHTQVQEWLWTELRMRVRGVPDRGLDAVRASFHLVNRVADVDWLAESVRVLGA